MHCSTFSIAAAKWGGRCEIPLPVLWPPAPLTKVVSLVWLVSESWRLRRLRPRSIRSKSIPLPLETTVCESDISYTPLTPPLSHDKTDRLFAVVQNCYGHSEFHGYKCNLFDFRISFRIFQVGNEDSHDFYAFERKNESQNTNHRKEILGTIAQNLTGYYEAPNLMRRSISAKVGRMLASWCQHSWQRGKHLLITSPGRFLQNIL